LTPGDNIYYNEGNVGIGTTGPTETLDVGGNTRLRGLLKDVFDHSGNIGDVLQPTPTGVQWTNNSTHHGSVPMGTIIMYGLVTPPDMENWLECSGGVVPGDAASAGAGKPYWPKFYFFLGKTYGDISGTLPDFRGRFPAMAGTLGMAGATGSTGTYINGIGEKNGQDMTSISTQFMPSHTHTADVSDDGHKHDIKVFYGDSGYVPDGSAGATGGSGNPQLNSFTSQDGGGLGAFSIIGTGHGSGTSHTIGFGSVDGGTGGGTENAQTGITVTTQNTGGSQAYAPPYLSIKFYIYAGPPGV
jgi:microcystin-dependent protein